MPFRVFEHTADIGLEGEAKDLDALFRDAARGLFAVVRGKNKVRPLETHPVAAKAGSLDALFVAFLEEFVFLQDAHGLVFDDVLEVKVARGNGGWTATAKVQGEPFSHERHPGCLHVKAVTRHGLVVEEPAAGRPAKARVILDI